MRNSLGPLLRRVMLRALSFADGEQKPAYANSWAGVLFVAVDAKR
ncbi:hypothetical protein OG453_23730 [Streptomyces sp. NBC_01381]|nr:hypothetical protein [Streptomyces sp. NBC_01381]MCX4669656.1 hypothetical protein [Streptomyces sp. NBC_01381]